MMPIFCCCKKYREPFKSINFKGQEPFPVVTIIVVTNIIIISLLIIIIAINMTGMKTFPSQQPLVVLSLCPRGVGGSEMATLFSLFGQR